MKQKIFIGVDIGLNGAVVAIFEDGTINTHTIPKLGDKISDSGLFEVFEEYKEYDVYIMLEEVHSLFGMSAKSNFSFGATYGKKQMIAAIMGVLYGSKLDYITPKKWQVAMWVASDKVYKSGTKIDTKKTSLRASKRLFPKQTFLATARSRVPHDGIVDAALIALFCKQKHS